MLLLRTAAPLLLAAAGVHATVPRAKALICRALERCIRPTIPSAVPSVRAGEPEAKSHRLMLGLAQKEPRKLSLAYIAEPVGNICPGNYWNKIDETGRNSSRRIADEIIAGDFDFVLFNDVVEARALAEVGEKLPFYYFDQFLDSAFPHLPWQWQCRHNLGVLNGKQLVLREVSRFERGLGNRIASCKLSVQEGPSKRFLHVVAVNAFTGPTLEDGQLFFDDLLRHLRQLDPEIPVIIMGKFPLGYTPMTFTDAEEAMRICAYLWAHQTGGSFLKRLALGGAEMPEPCKSHLLYSNLAAAQRDLVRASSNSDGDIEGSIFVSSGLQVVAYRSWIGSGFGAPDRLNSCVTVAFPHE